MLYDNNEEHSSNYPRQVDFNLIQYEDNVFVWFDENGVPIGVHTDEQTARRQLQQYVQSLR